MSTAVSGVLFIEFDYVMCSTLNSNLVLDQENHQLLAVHQCHRRGIRSGCFLTLSSAEVTVGNNKSLFMRSKASADLLNNWRLNILLPFLHLNGHSCVNHITHNQGATNIDATVPASAGDLDLLKTYFRKNPGNQVLKRLPLHVEKTLKQRLSHLLVMLFYLKGET